MKSRHRSVEAMVDDQVRRWELLSKADEAKPAEPVIALTRLPGSGGDLIAERLAGQTGFDLFDTRIIEKVAESANLSSACIKTLDGRRISWVENWVLALRTERYLWREEYIRHLARVIAVIGKHGRAVILGRGASFILPPEECLRVLVIAPLEYRIENVRKELGLSAEDAKQRVVTIESERRAYIRQYFHADMSDPIHYDLVLNTAFLDVGEAVQTILAARKAKMTFLGARASGKTVRK
ncbi:MAG: cytidylate kinase-like family protein [bacterium]